jgi:hypothetical protein
MASEQQQQQIQQQQELQQEDNANFQTMLETSAASGN